MSLTKQDYIDAIDIAIEQKDREVADGLINEFENLYVKKEKKNKEEEKVEILTERAKVDPKGVVLAISQGINEGIFNLADFPGEVVNLVINSINSSVGKEFIPKQLNVTEAIDLATNYLTGFSPIETAKSDIPEVDTPSERILGKVSQYVTEGAAGGMGLTRATAREVGRIGERAALDLTDKTRKAATQEILPGAGAGAGAGLGVELFPDSALAEFLGGVTGSTATTMLGSLASEGIKRGVDLFRSFSEEGVKRRVSEDLQKTIENPEEVIKSMESNQLILEEAGIDPNTVTTAQLVNNPTLSANLNVLSSDYNTVNSLIADGRKTNNEFLVSQIRETIPKQKTATDVVNSANSYTLQLESNLKDQIDLANKQLAVLRGEGRDFSVDEESLKLVGSLEEAYFKAKKIESGIWESIEKKQPLNLQPLKKEIKKLARLANKSGFSSDDIPSNVYQISNKMGVKKGKPLRNDFGFLSEYRSTTLEQMRKARAAGDNNKYRLLKEVEEEISNFIEKSGQEDIYRSAAAYSRTIRENFNKGTIGRLLRVNVDQSSVIDPEAALEAIISTGGKGSARAKEIKALSEGIEVSPEVSLPKAEGLEQSLIEGLKNKFYDTGANFSNFKKRFGPTLNKFPGLSKNLKEISDEIDIVSRDIAQKEGRLSSDIDRKKVAIAALASADPERLYTKLSKMTKQDLINIREVAKADGVEQGLQAVVLENYLNEIRKVSQGDWAEGFKSLDFLLENNKDFKLTFDQLLTSGQKENLKRFSKVSEIVFKTPDTTYANDNIKEILGSPLAETTASLFALQAANRFSPGGPASLAIASRFSTASRKVIANLTKKQSKAVIEQALLNPDVLKTMLRIKTKAKTTKEADNLIRAYLLTSGVEVPYQEAQEEEISSP